MDPLWNGALARRYAAALDTYDDVLRACPDSLWQASIWVVKKTDPYVWPVSTVDGTAYPGAASDEDLLQVYSAFWNVAYHALFHVDFYLGGAARKGFRPPQPFREADHHGNTIPARPYTRDELLSYVAHNREKSRRVILSLSAEQAAAPVKARFGVAFGEFLLTTLTHTLEHATQLAYFLEGHGVETAGPPGQQVLRDAVRFRSDAEIDAFAKAAGGYGRLLPLVFTGFCRNIAPGEPATVVFDLGERYAVRVTPAGARFDKRPVKQPDAVMRLSPHDFLRLMVRDLDAGAAFRDGRAFIEGDEGVIARLFASAR